MRNGHLHRYFGLSREEGLSKAIAGSLPVGQVIHRGVLDNLDFIPTGALPPNRSELLQHLNFASLLDAVGAQYDIVLVDAPPILPVSDALVIGTHAGAVFILARAGVTTEDELSESIKRLNHAGIAPRACCSTTCRCSWAAMPLISGTRRWPIWRAERRPGPAVPRRPPSSLIGSSSSPGGREKLAAQRNRCAMLSRPWYG